jgi:hypothetical protein
LNGEGFSQLYKRTPDCTGNCENNFDNRPFCYTQPGYLSLNFNLQVGYEFIFIRKWTTVYSYASDAPTCTENSLISTTTLTSATTSSTISSSPNLFLNTSFTTSTQKNTFQTDSVAATSIASLTSTEESVSTGTTKTTTTTTTTTLDLCAAHPCQNNGTCTSLQNSYSCNCSIGFSGLNCDTRGLN